MVAEFTDSQKDSCRNCEWDRYLLCILLRKKVHDRIDYSFSDLKSNSLVNNYLLYGITDNQPINTSNSVL